MANYQYTSDLLTDVLFRAGEPTDASSDYYTRALVYLNRAYYAVCNGGSEISPTVNEDWLWLTQHGAIVLHPRMELSINAVKGSTTVALSSIPTDYTGANVSIAGWYILGAPDIGGRYKIATHTIGSTTATIDIPWIRETVTGLDVTLERLEYTLPNDTLRLISPLFVWGRSTAYATHYVPIESIFESVNRTRTVGISPAMFSLLDPQTIIIDKAPTYATRAEYEYLILPPPLTNAPLEEPLVPHKDRRILADLALFWLLMDKNDNRADGIGLLARNQLHGMAADNRAAIAAMTRAYARHTIPRSNRPYAIRGYV